MKKQPKPQKWMVVVVENSTLDLYRTKDDPPSCVELIVTDPSEMEALYCAVEERNLISGYNPEEDGGFVAVHAYTRDELQRRLHEMDASD